MNNHRLYLLGDGEGRLTLYYEDSMYGRDVTINIEDDGLKATERKFSDQSEPYTEQIDLKQRLGEILDYADEVHKTWLKK